MSYISKMTYKANKLDQTDPGFLVCDQSSSVDVCMQDHISFYLRHPG